ncbi:MAG: hypothetical protein MR210_07860 [Erysipelotrichaceae bacterium]|nr:hypothetical protein [Erysipelotrichaceae bacterium]MDY5252953.1 hypothetical protein [Erysipelotrichaceae bacterium]
MGRERNRKKNKENKIELTETQKNIIKIRKRMNRRDLEEEKFNGFAPEKVWTYLWIFLFPPYGIYRLFDKKNNFLKQQKIIWCIVSVVYMLCLFDALVKLIKA